MNPQTLFNVKQFQQKYAELTKDHIDDELQTAAVDISTEDLHVITRFEEIEQEIKQELTGLTDDKSVTNRLRASEQRMKAQQMLLCTRPENHGDIPKNRKREINYISSQMAKEEPSVFQPIDDDEVILSVALYHTQKNAKMQEFLVLGSQKLTELRDRFYCLQDHLLSDKTTSSGYFFIENVFYNDMRDPDSMDYSSCIIDWTNENKRYTDPALGIFVSKKMEDTCFKDLSVKVGQEYFYVHRGNCQHSIVFTNLRLPSAEDCKDANKYPYHTFQSKVRRRKCRVCEIYTAKWVAFNDPMADESPCFFCDNCYRPLHYSYDGKLLYSDYTVFPYFHE